MSKRGGGSRLELRLNLSPSPSPSSSTAREGFNSSSLEEFSTSSILSHSSEMTVEGSCVSSNIVEEQQQQQETRAMLLVGCPRCLMYVMLSEVNPDPKCPKCKSTVLLDFLNEQNCKNKQDHATHSSPSITPHSSSTRTT